jgi:hypothetical protein
MSDIFHKELILDYSGPIDFTIKKKLVSLLREKADTAVSDLGARRRCSYVFEELLTNAHEYYKYIRINEEPIQVTLELVNKERMDMGISSTILKQDTPAFLAKIEQLNTEEEEDLKNLFYQKLQSGDKDKNGGGVGLITVKLKNGFSYNIELVEKSALQNLFCLSTSVGLKD